MKSRSLAYVISAALVAVSLVFPAVLKAQEAAPAAPETSVDTGCKVGFVNLSRVLEESQGGKQVKLAIEAERDKAYAQLKPKQDQLEQIESQISALTQEIVTKGAVWDDYTKNRKRNELQGLQLEYNKILNELQLDKNEIQKDFAKKNNEMLKPLEDKLNAVMEEVGGQGGFCVILDVSPPQANMPVFNPILYRDPGRDITDQVIAAVDKK